MVCPEQIKRKHFYNLLKNIILHAFIFKNYCISECYSKFDKKSKTVERGCLPPEIQEFFSKMRTSCVEKPLIKGYMTEKEKICACDTKLVQFFV